ncbi:MAG: hypothetical protein IIY06_01945, partial [Proteobacteria bacterium]|nr:hypothetical protein [Pseudomonadota bacterium]
VAGGYSPKALRALYNALSTNFACIDKNIRTTGLAYFHIVMFSLRIQDKKMPRMPPGIAAEGMRIERSEKHPHGNAY